MRYGQGQADAWNKYNLGAEEGIKQLLADHGYTDYKKLVEESRPKDAVVPLATYVDFPAFNIKLPPGKSRAGVREAGGRDLVSFEGESGRIVMSQYQDRFAGSFKNLKRCVSDDDPDYNDLLSCFADGMASIEAFVNYMTQRHRQNLPKGDEQKVPLDFKIFDWIPRLNGGIQVNEGYRNWQDFEQIRRIRNKQLNLWRTGIARLLLDLHVLTGRLAPPDVVRYAYLPDIEIVDE